MKVYYAYVGDDIVDACQNLVRMATAVKHSVKMIFNDIALVAKPNDDPSKIVSRFRKKRAKMEKLKMQ